MEKKTFEFCQKFPKHYYDKGDIILRPNETPAGIAYINDGFVRQYDINDSGNTVTVNVMKSGTHFPMSWAINDEKNVWYFEAIEKTTLNLVPKAEMLKFFKSDPEVMYSFIKRLLSGATGQQRRMAHIMGGGAYTRVLFELIIQFKRFGKSTKEGVCVYVSESELGSIAGLSREAVSRELSKLQKKKVISRSYKKICTHEIKKLEDELGFLI